jgi:hypothetical protein
MIYQLTTVITNLMTEDSVAEARASEVRVVTPQESKQEDASAR